MTPDEEIAAIRAQLADDRDRARELYDALVADAERLEDTTQALTAAQLRAHLARTTRGLAALLRYLGRRGL
jgi:hypothetical protein